MIAVENVSLCGMHSLTTYVFMFELFLFARVIKERIFPGNLHRYLMALTAFSDITYKIMQMDSEMTSNICPIRRLGTFTPNKNNDEGVGN